MLANFKRWFDPPFFADDAAKTKQTQIANTLIIYLAAALFVTIFVFIPLFANQKIGSWLVSGSILCVLAVGRHLIFQGRWRLGGGLIISVINLCILGLMILSGGSSSTAMFYFAVIVVVAGFFLEARMINWLTIPTFLIAMGISLLEDQGLVALPKVFEFNSLFSWVVTGLGLWFMIHARNLIVGNLENALALARQENAERLLAEQSLVENESHYRQLFENSTVGIYRTTPEGRILLANPAMIGMLGFSSFEELSARNLEQEGYAPYYHRTRFIELIEQTGEIKGLESRWTRKDGTSLFVRESASVIRDAQGKPIFYDGIVEDINTHRLSEDARKTAEANYRTIFENATVGIFQSTPQGRFRTVNPAMARIYGYDSPQDMLASITNISEQVYVDLSSLPEFQRKMSEQAGEIEFIGENYRKDGSIIWTVTNASAVMDHAGSLLYYEGFVRDITERKLAEKTLQTNEEKYRLMVETSSEGVIFLDKALRLTLVNRQAASMLGYSIEELLGQQLDSLLFEEDLEDHRLQMQTQGQGSVYERCFRRRDGSRLWTIISATVITDTEGRLDGAFAMLTDITERKQAEVALQASEQNARRTAEQLRMVNRIGIRITAGLGLEQLLQTIDEQSQQIGIADSYYIALYDHTTESIDFLYSRTDGKRISRPRINIREKPILANKIIETHQTLFIPDFQNESTGIVYNPISPTPTLTRTYLGVPLLVNEQVIGLISMQNKQANAYSPEQIETLELLATQAALAIQNSQLYEQAQQELVERKHAEEETAQRNKYLTLLNQLGRALNTLSSLPVIIQQISDLIGQVFDNRNLYIALYNQETNLISFPIYRMAGEKRDSAEERPPSNGLTEYVIRSRTPVLISDHMPETLAERGISLIGAICQSYLGVPILVDERVIGVIAVQDYEHTQVYNTNHVELLTTIALQAAIAIENSRLYEAIQQELAERKRAEERTLKSEKKYRELFEVNKDGIVILPLNSYGSPSVFIELNDAAAEMLGYTREEMLKRSPRMLEPHTSPEQFAHREAEFQSKGTLNFETVLLHKNGHPVFADFTAQLIEYEDQPAIMQIVRDVSESKQRERELQAFASLSAALRTAPSRAEMLPVIVEQLAALLQCDSISADMIDPLTHETVIEAVYGVWSPLIGFRQPPETGLNAIILKSRQPYHNNNLTDVSIIAIPGNLIEGIHAIAGVPLIAQDQVIGFLWMGRNKEIADSEVRLLAATADIAANAIHRATLHERTQKYALDLTHAYDTTLEGWAHALELRDQETEGHARRVVQMTVDLARAIGIGEDLLEHVRRGALLHDIGKMGIPDSVLLKPGTLNDREWEIMHRHPEYAYQFLEPIEYLRPVLDIPYCHHEKWDGSGYPRGLKGEEIPMAARLFAIVDVWDALRSDRPYRQAWTVEKTHKHILDQSGLHFDPEVVLTFLKMLDDQQQKTS